MPPPLDELYFIWLSSLVSDSNVREPSLTHEKLLKQLFTKEFVWIIPNDDNRMEDGKDLRVEFISREGLGEVDPNWMQLGCSVLELMIGLARHLEFMGGGEADQWFWQLVENLGLSKFNDKRRYPRGHIDEILDSVIWRTYNPNGLGGFFPLQNPDEDQTRVELWYQLCSYVNERN